MALVLASTSSRRRELLALLQIPFDIADPQVKETLDPGLSPEDQARALAMQKARACAGRFPGCLVLGSDTLLALGSAVLGKPGDMAQAEAMLQRLRGRVHVIYTAAALVQARDTVAETEVAVVQVRMRAFGDNHLHSYLRTGESLGKAGAYSIQGRGGDLIERIEGDFTAVVGLPLRLVATMLARHGLATPVDLETLYREKPYPNWGRFSS